MIYVERDTKENLDNIEVIETIEVKQDTIQPVSSYDSPDVRVLQTNLQVKNIQNSSEAVEIQDQLEVQRPDDLPSEPTQEQIKIEGNLEESHYRSFQRSQRP